MTIINGIEYVTIQEAATVLGVTPGRVYHFVDDGWLSCHEVFGRKVISATDLAKMRENLDPKTGLYRNPLP